jgi:putative DNA primase/helicase
MKMRHELADRCKDRWPNILMQLGLLSGAALKGIDSPCPVCGGRDRFRFSDRGYGRWFCRGCGYGGDGVRLIMAIKGVDFLEAARLVESVVGKAPQCTAHSSGAGKTKDALKSWRNASPFTRGSAADFYLRSRAIELTGNEALSLRSHPSLWHWPSQVSWSAMVALVRLADGTEITVHQTFLTPDGRKAPLGDKVRLFPAGVAPEGGGVWFGEADTAREFIVAEGLESLLSALRIFGASAGCAALSAGGIRRLILPPQARRVRVFADHDPLGQGLGAAREAWQRWRTEGRDVAVSLAEQVGWDANDVLISRLRAHAQ